MTKEISKKMKQLRESLDSRYISKGDIARLFAELFLLIHQDLEEIKELLKK